MFNERYGLQRAAIDGTKPMTRRLISNQQAIYSLDEQEFIGQLAVSENFVKKYSRYQVGEVVAIAQNYKDCGYDGGTKYGWCYDENEERTDVFYKDVPGWKNKMFVRSSRMPHRIRITDVKVERLQDISDEDCLKEGVKQWTAFTYCVDGIDNEFIEPRDAFAALIDKVSGRGTWDRNPWVFAYTYELIK